MSRGMGWVAALVWALAFTLGGCGSSSSGTDAAVGGGDSGGGGTGPTRCTSAAECDDGDVCTEDTCAATGACQHTPVLGTQPIYTACTKHCDCDTGYCYDEGYLAPFRFCTRPCGGVSEGCGDEATNECITLNPNWFDPPVTKTAICVPPCASDADCTAIDAAWDGCTTGVTEVVGTDGNAHTASLRKTCIKN